MEGTILRLLIADDEDAFRDALKLKLESRKQIRVSEASSTEAVQQQITNDDFDLVLLDLKFQFGYEGLDLLADIKKRKPQTKIMVLSAHHDIPIVVEAMKRGAIDFIPKDQDVEDLVIMKVEKFIQDATLLAEREQVIKGLYETVFTKESNRKGKALETLVATLFSSIEGFVEVQRVHTETEEIDFTFRNESKHPMWQRESPWILVECKNWRSKRVGKNELVLFKEKLENRYGRCKLGFLVSAEEFAKTVLKEMLRSAKTDYLVVPIDGRGLHQLVHSENRNQLLLDFLKSAIMT